MNKPTREVPIKEFSKRVLITSYCIGVAIILFAMVIQIMFIINSYDGNSEIVVALIGGAFGEMGIVSGFYAWKAKSENSIKLQAQYGINPTNEEEI